MSLWGRIKKKAKKAWKDITRGSFTLNTSEGKVKPAKTEKQRKENREKIKSSHIRTVDRSVDARNAVIKRQAKQAAKQKKEAQKAFRTTFNTAKVKSDIKKSESIFKTQNNGMSRNDVIMNENLSRMNPQVQKKAYASLDKHGSKNAGIEKGFATRTAKAEEKAAKENPLLYNALRTSAPVDTKMINQITLGKQINTTKVDKSIPGKVGSLVGSAAQYAVTGAPFEGAIAKSISKVATKKAAQAAAKKGVTEAAKNVAKDATKKLTKKKVGDFAARRAADAIAGSGMNLSMSASQAVNEKGKINKKAFAKNFAENTAMDAAFGAGMEGVGKVTKAAVKSVKSSKRASSALKKANAKAKMARKEAADVTEKLKNANDAVDKMMLRKEKSAALAKAKKAQKNVERLTKITKGIEIKTTNKAKASENAPSFKSEQSSWRKGDVDSPAGKTSEIEKQAVEKATKEKAKAKEKFDNTRKRLNIAKASNEISAKEYSFKYARAKKEYEISTKKADADIEKAKSDTSTADKAPDVKSGDEVIKPKKEKVSEVKSLETKGADKAPDVPAEKSSAESKSNIQPETKVSETENKSPKEEKATREIKQASKQKIKAREQLKTKKAEIDRKLEKGEISLAKSEKDEKALVKSGEKETSVVPAEKADEPKNEPETDGETVSAETKNPKETNKTAEYVKWKKQSEARKLQREKKRIDEKVKNGEMSERKAKQLKAKAEKKFAKVVERENAKLEWVREEDADKVRDKALPEPGKEKPTENNSKKAAKAKKQDVANLKKRAVKENTKAKAEFERARNELKIARSSEEITANEYKYRYLRAKRKYEATVEKNNAKIKSAEEAEKAAKEAKQKSRKFAKVDYDIPKRKDKKSVTKAYKDTVRSLVDSLTGFEDVAKQARKAGDKVRYEKIMGQTNAVRQASSKANYSLERGQKDFNGKTVGKSAKEIFDGWDSTTAQGKALNEYAFERINIDRHHAVGKAEQLVKDGKMTKEEAENFKYIKDVTGRTADESAERMRELERDFPGIKEKSDEIIRWFRNEQDVRVQSGLISKRDKELLQDIYPSYVPTHRADKWNSKGIEGGEPIDPIAAGKDADADNGVVSAGDEKTTKGSKMDLVPLQDQMVRRTHQLWNAAETNQLLKAVGGDSYAEAMVKGGLSPEEAADQLAFLVKHGKDSNVYKAIYYVNGKAKTVRIPEQIYKGLNDHYANGHFGNVWDSITKASSYVSSPWKKAITTWNPLFLVTNGIKDNIDGLLKCHNLRYYISSYSDALKSLITKDEYYEAYLSTGTKKSQFTNVSDELRDSKNWFKKNIVGRIEAANDAVEAFARMTEFHATFKEKGVSIKDANRDLLNLASQRAADITDNFGRSGKMGKSLNSGTVPFFNPAMQGTSKTVRMFQDAKAEGLKGWLSLIGKASIVGVAPSVINELLHADDEEYQKMNARDKQAYFLFRRKDGVYVKIPKGRVAATLGLIPQAIASGDADERNILGILRMAMQQTGPQNPFDSNVLSPFLAAKNNKSWTGNPIESQWEEDHKNSEDIWDGSTSEIGKALGKLELSKKLKLSPKKIDYLIDAETGVFGDLLLPATTKARTGDKKGMSKVTAAALQMATRRFTLDSVYSNKTMEKYYNQVTKLTKDTTSSNKSVAKAAKNKLAIIKTYDDRLSKVNSALKKVKEEGGTQEQQRQLTKLRRDIMQAALSGKENDGKDAFKDIDVVYKALGADKTIKMYGDKSMNNAYNAYKKIVGKDKGKTAAKHFYRSARNVLALSAQGYTSDTARAVGLAAAGAGNGIFKAYGLDTKSEGNDASSKERAREYIKNGGSIREFTKLSDIRKKSYRIDKQNSDSSANWVSYAYTLAKHGASNRAYKVFDIRPGNVHNAFAMIHAGATPKDLEKVKKYAPKYMSAEKAYRAVEMSGVKGKAKKAALYSTLCWWIEKYNKSTPYGKPNWSQAGTADTHSAKVNAAKTKTITKYRTRTLHNVPIQATMRNGDKIDLTKLSKAEVQKVLLNSKGVRSLKYGDRKIKEKVKETVAKKASKKDNTSLDDSKGKSGGYRRWYRRYYRRWYRRHYGRGGGSRGGSGAGTIPDTIKTTTVSGKDVNFGGDVPTEKYKTQKSNYKQILKAYTKSSYKKNNL